MVSSQLSTTFFCAVQRFVPVTLSCSSDKSLPCFCVVEICADEMHLNCVLPLVTAPEQELDCWHIAQSGLAHDDNCCLCDQTLDTAFHLSSECPFTNEIWNDSQCRNLCYLGWFATQARCLSGGVIFDVLREPKENQEHLDRSLCTCFGIYGMNAIGGYSRRKRCLPLR
jgi:hypothetical protein